MSEFILVRGARQLLTLGGPDAPRRGAALQTLNVIEDGSVLIRDDRIFALGTTRRIENMKEARNALEIPATGHVVMPGFVDVHMNVSARQEGSGVSDRSRTRRLQKAYEETLGLMRSCLQHGTLAADVCGQAAGDIYDEDVPLLRQLAKVGRNPVHMYRRWQVRQKPDDPVQQAGMLETFASLRKRKLIDGIDLPASFLIARDELTGVPAELIGACSKERLHVRLTWPGGTADELRRALDWSGAQAVHCSTSLSEGEVQVCSSWDRAVLFSPGAEIGKTSGSAARQLIDRGAHVALGSGYHAIQTPGYSMQMAVTLAVMNAHLTTEEAILAATVNAACAAGCIDQVGSLQAGKRADLLVLTIPDYREIPRQFGINHVGMVFREGQLVFNRSRWRIGAHGAAAGRMRS